jgi:malonyl-CoA/methylmalonyl-CoA synthetase
MSKPTRNGNDSLITDSFWDRTNCVPRHTGSNVLPKTPMLSQLLRHAHHGRLAIRDLNLGVERSYGDLLSDVLYLRNLVEARLSPSVKAALENGEEVYIGVLAAGGYEYAVGVLTVMALKAAIVPMST